MKYLQYANDYQRYADLFEAYGINQSNIWDKLNALVLPDPQSLPVQFIAAADRHEDFLLTNFNSVTEAYHADAVLRRNGYDPIFLTLENAYFETLSAIEDLNESLWSSVKGFLNTVTNGGSPLGILQFVLDIIGLIPASLLGVPIDTAANLLNASIYFWNEEYVMGMISGIMCVPGVGQAIGGVLRGLLWPFKAVFKTLGSAIVKGVGVKAAAQAVRATPGAGKAVAAFAPALKKFAGFMATTGATVFSKITSFIDYIIKKVSFGKLSLPNSVVKWTDDLVKQAKLIGSSADEAAEVLLKQEASVVATAADTATTSSKAVGAEAEQAALAAGKSSTDAAQIAAKEADRVAKKFDNIPGFSKDLQNEVMRSAGYKKLVADGVSDKIKDEFVRVGINTRLMNSIVKGTKGSKSLVNALKDPQIVAALAKNNGLKVTDKVLLDAFSSGNLKQIQEVLDIVIANPQLMKAISPRTAKAITVFKTTPELFTNGPKVFRSAVTALGKLPNIKLVTKSGKAIFSRHAARSGKYYLLWVLKMYLKQSECAQYLIKGKPSEALSNVTSVATSAISSAAISNTKETAVLESVKAIVASSALLLEEETKGMGSLLSSEDLDELRKKSPEGYADFTKQQEELTKSVKTFAAENTLKDPCSMDAAVAEASAGGALSQGLISQTGIYKAKGGGDSYEIFDEEAAKPLTNVIKSQLAAVNQDPNIDPQHPLSATDPYMKAYFSDAYDFEEEIYMPNTTGTSRLDKTLDLMVKNGEIDKYEKDDIASATLKHWEEGTVPEKLEQELGTESEEIDERFNWLKIGKVNIKTV